MKNIRFKEYLAGVLVPADMVILRNLPFLNNFTFRHFPLVLLMRKKRYNGLKKKG